MQSKPLQTSLSPVTHATDSTLSGWIPNTAAASITQTPATHQRACIRESEASIKRRNCVESLLSFFFRACPAGFLHIGRHRLQFPFQCKQTQRMFVSDPGDFRWQVNLSD